MYTIIKSNIKKFSLLTIFIVAGQLLLIYAATINALVLNELIAMNLERFLKLSIYQMIVWCGIIFLDWVVKNYQVEVIQEFNLEIRNRVATDISNSTYQEFHSKSSGTYLSWLNNDVQTLNDQAFKQLFLVIKGISGTIFAVVTLNHYHWSLTVATLFSLMIMLLVPKIFASKMREVSLNLTNQNEAFLKSSETILNGFDVLASFLNMVSNVLYVDQKAYLFEGTIRDNILLEENYTDEEILQSLEQVGLSVKDFPNNILDYYVGDDGRLLSGGQKQKITLARGLIRNKKIVLIDEGTSAIDRRTSLAIERKILDREDLTVIIVTHAPHPELKQYFTKIYQFPKDFI